MISSLSHCGGRSESRASLCTESPPGKEREKVSGTDRKRSGEKVMCSAGTTPDGLDVAPTNPAVVLMWEVRRLQRQSMKWS